MCDNCEAIDKAIARYKWLREQLPDYQINRIAEDLVLRLEAAKLALHPKTLVLHPKN